MTSTCMFHMRKCGSSSEGAPTRPVSFDDKAKKAMSKVEQTVRVTGDLGHSRALNKMKKEKISKVVPAVPANSKEM